MCLREVSAHVTCHPVSGHLCEASAHVTCGAGDAASDFSREGSPISFLLQSQEMPLFLSMLLFNPNSNNLLGSEAAQSLVLRSP